MIAPNVIISKNYDTIKRLFFGPTDLGDAKKISLDEVLQSIDEDDPDILIASPGSNTTVLEVDLNMPAAPSPQGFTNIKFLQTSKVLEYFFLDGSNLELPLQYVYSLAVKEGVGLGESIKKLDKYYVAFGTGDDLSQWAGPFAMDLGAANMTLDDNVKVITLGFIMGKLESVRSYTQKLYDTLGWGDDKLNPVAPRNSNIEFSGKVRLSGGLHETLGPLLLKRHSNIERIKSKPISWNPWIREVLRYYLASIYEDGRDGRHGQLEAAPRVLIILGNDFDAVLNKNLGKHNTFKRNYGTRLKRFGIELSEVLEGEQAGYPNEARTALIKAADNYKRQNNAQAMSEVETEYMKLAKKLAENAKEYKSAQLSMCTKIYFKDEEKRKVEVLDPLFRFTGELRRTQGAVDYGLFEITDARIINLLDQASKRGRIGSFLGNEGDPKLVFGDVNLINKLIYLSDEGTDVVDGSEYGKAFTDPLLDSIDWEGYRKDFKETILKPERVQNSSFKEKINFGPFSPESKEIKDVKDIIFLHGLTNSNVISVSYQKDIIQAALLSFRTQSIYQNPTVSKFTRQTIVNNDFKTNDLVIYLKKKGLFKSNVIQTRLSLIEYFSNLEGDEAEGVKKLEEASLTEKIKTGRAGSNESFDEYLDIIIGIHDVLSESKAATRERIQKYADRLEQFGNSEDRAFGAQLQREIDLWKPSLNVPHADDADAKNTRTIQTQADLIEEASKLITKISIKTLPFFNQVYYFDKKCYLLSLQNDLITTRNTSDLKSKTMLTGNYLIKGARHFIGNGEAYSEFELIKEKSTEDAVDPKVKEVIINKEMNNKPTTPDPDGTRFGGPATGKPKAPTRQEVAKELSNNNKRRLPPR